MKRILFLYTLLLTGLFARAEMRVAKVVRTPHTQREAIYVMEDREKGHIHLLSAEPRAQRVLGYITGRWNEDSIPDALRVMLSYYAEQIETAQAFPEQDIAYAANIGRPAIAPLVQSVWSQRSPYNNLCPLDPATQKRCAAGCVATAIAQIMHYWQWPQQGIGSHSYEWQGKTLTANFGETTYDWAHMLNNYDTTSVTSTHRTAVATLVYHVGVASNMNYSSEGSGATSAVAISRMADFFDYDAGMSTISVNYDGAQALEDGVYNELCQGRPVMLSAATCYGEGHAFVCDGTDDKGLFRINWGWGGLADGYYALSALTPTEQSTGGSPLNKGYTTRIVAYIGIQPNKQNPMVEQLGANILNLLSDSTIDCGDNIICALPRITNIGACNLEKYYTGLAIRQNGSLIDVPVTKKHNGLTAGYNLTKADTLSGALPTLANGDYYLLPFFYTERGTTAPIAIVNGLDSIPFHVQDGRATFYGNKIDYSIRDFCYDVDYTTVQLGFESPAPYYQVCVMAEQDTLYSKRLSAKYATVDVGAPGRYTVRILPLDYAYQELADAYQTEIEVIDYTVQDLQAEVDKNTIHLTYSSPAPKFYITFTLDKSMTVSRDTIIAAKELEITLNRTGSYTITVYPLEETERRQIGPEGQTTATIEQTAFEAVSATGVPTYYDLLGRPTATPIPGGIYIRRQGHKTTTIIKQ